MTRLPLGGRVDRSRPVRATLDGVEVVGLAGDTLASALLAAGSVGGWRSAYRGRPRGVFSAGPEEPNALVQVLAPYRESLVPATMVPLVDGLVARRCAGVGRLDPTSDPARYEKRYEHVDVLVVGAGPAGLAAALAASAGGARVLLVDERSEPGGSLLADHDDVPDADGRRRPAAAWVAETVTALAARPGARVLSWATAVGYDDVNHLMVLERCTDHLVAGASPRRPRHRVWHVRARRVVLATGAIERPLVFAGNDRPGVMLSSAVRGYLSRYAVAPGRRAVVATVDDSGYATAAQLLAAGVDVAAVVDSRPVASPMASLLRPGVPVLPGAAVCATFGDASGALASVDVASLAPLPSGEFDHRRLAGPPTRIEADLLAVGGGWSPQLQLFAAARGRTAWDAAADAWLPAASGQGERVVGSAAGAAGVAECVRQGATAGRAAALELGFDGTGAATTDGATEGGADGGVDGAADGSPRRGRAAGRPVRLVPSASGEPAQWHDHIVDLERDATVADVWRAVGAGLRSPEHVKRYTTIGTGRDQGRTSSVVTVGLVALARGEVGDPVALADLAPSGSRPPVVPVAFAALAGRDVGRLADPVRTTPLHALHRAAGAQFEVVGQWHRAWYYPRPGESAEEAVLRECRAARTGVAMMDASTLGKIEVAGSDAGVFLDRIYTGTFSTLAVGAARYGVMCTADGMVLDDGVTLRLAPDRYLATTTTGNAARVLDWLEEWHQTEWPELDVTLTSVTEQWVTVAVVGPRSRDVLARLAPGLDVSTAAFGVMTWRETTLSSGVPARIARISFSGELAYEINVAGWFGPAVWQSVAQAGADLGITPYGTEAMHVLRAEKGYPIIGQDTDGTVSPLDLGLGWAVSRRKDFVGRRSLRRPDTARPDRKQLVGLLPADPDALLAEGAQLVAAGTPITPEVAPVPMIGHVTSSYRSAALGRTFALALVAGGRDRVGEQVLAPFGGPGDEPVLATVTEPVLYDPEGARRDG